jgi:ubiquinone/menaquinone biosynthesis C-methylase UbiE/DNA-binding transcriptional ArsR family regulator
MPGELDQVVEVLRATGEPSRLRILALLSREELAVNELCQILDQSQPRVSRHLRLLTENGLVERFPDGGWVFYRLAADPDHRALINQVQTLVGDADPTLARDVERLNAVRAERFSRASSYFAKNAQRWDELRSLYVAEADVEASILGAAGPGPFRRMIDLGTGSGRMLTLFKDRAESAVGLDLSQQMLNIARANVADAGLCACELRHGDIFATRLPGHYAELVIVHQVLHYLSDPAAAVAEAARLVAPNGRLLIIDFAPHSLEYLREAHAHRRLGFADEEVRRWLVEAGLQTPETRSLPPKGREGLTVKIWAAHRKADAQRRAA